MTYSFLAEPLRETAERAKAYFKQSYGATKFICETEIEPELPLKPTWQASMQDGYRLCIDVHEALGSLTIHEFVAKCAAKGVPIKLWIALPGTPTGPGFTRELRSAKDMGVGVVQFPEDGGAPYELHKPVPLSLFALRQTNLQEVEAKRRETVKKAEDSFLDGSPEDGCRLICEELEAVTRRFAEHSYAKKWWKPSAGGKPLKPKFFTTDSWANMLQSLDERLLEQKAKSKCSTFSKELVVGARQYTKWRNSLSHKPKTLKERAKRDAKLRTMYEATRDLLLEWYRVARTLKLEK